MTLITKIGVFMDFSGNLGLQHTF